MEKDGTENISYYLVIDRENMKHLAQLRQWAHLQIAFETKTIWLTNFAAEQIESVAVKSLPYKSIYYAQNGKLYLQNHLLPYCDEPLFKWLPIEEGLPLKIGKYNHNYFGQDKKIGVQLVAENKEREASAMLTNISLLKKYIETAPKIRLNKLRWVLVNNDQAMIFGTPILPLNAKVYWLSYSSYIPIGFNFDFYLLNEFIKELLDEENKNLIVWNEDTTYFKVDKQLIMPLSLSSFKKSLLLKNNTNIKNVV